MKLAVRTSSLCRRSSEFTLASRVTKIYTMATRSLSDGLALLHRLKERQANGEVISVEEFVKEETARSSDGTGQNRNMIAFLKRKFSQVDKDSLDLVASKFPKPSSLINFLRGKTSRLDVDKAEDLRTEGAKQTGSKRSWKSQGSSTNKVATPLPDQGGSSNTVPHSAPPGPPRPYHLTTPNDVLANTPCLPPVPVKPAVPPPLPTNPPSYNQRPNLSSHTDRAEPKDKPKGYVPVAAVVGGIFSLLDPVPSRRQPLQPHRQVWPAAVPPRQLLEADPPPSRPPTAVSNLASVHTPISVPRPIQHVQPPFAASSPFLPASARDSISIPSVARVPVDPPVPTEAEVRMTPKQRPSAAAVAGALEPLQHSQFEAFSKQVVAEIVAVLPSASKATDTTSHNPRLRNRPDSVVGAALAQVVAGTPPLHSDPQTDMLTDGFESLPSNEVLPAGHSAQILPPVPVLMDVDLSGVQNSLGKDVASGLTDTDATMRSPKRVEEQGVVGAAEVDGVNGMDGMDGVEGMIEAEEVAEKKAAFVNRMELLGCTDSSYLMEKVGGMYSEGAEMGRRRKKKGVPVVLGGDGPRVGDQSGGIVEGQVAAGEEGEGVSLQAVATPMFEESKAMSESSVMSRGEGVGVSPVMTAGGHHDGLTERSGQHGAAVQGQGVGHSEDLLARARELRMKGGQGGGVGDRGVEQTILLHTGNGQEPSAEDGISRGIVGQAHDTTDDSQSWSSGSTRSVGNAITEQLQRFALDDSPYLEEKLAGMYSQGAKQRRRRRRREGGLLGAGGGVRVAENGAGQTLADGGRTEMDPTASCMEGMSDRATGKQEARSLQARHGGGNEAAAGGGEVEGERSYVDKIPSHLGEGVLLTMPAPPSLEVAPNGKSDDPEGPSQIGTKGGALGPPIKGVSSSSTSSASGAANGIVTPGATKMGSASASMTREGGLGGVWANGITAFQVSQKQGVEGGGRNEYRKIVEHLPSVSTSKNAAGKLAQGPPDPMVVSPKLGCWEGGEEESGMEERVSSGGHRKPKRRVRDPAALQHAMSRFSPEETQYMQERFGALT